jgi:hypothetical protein
MEEFNTKIDRWLFITLTVIIFICLFVAMVAILKGGSSNYSIAITVLVFGTGIPIWLLGNSKYIIKNGVLKVVCGPFYWRVSLSLIESIEDSSDQEFNSENSIGRIKIYYDQGKSIVVSPVDKPSFLQSLQQR